MMGRLLCALFGHRWLVQSVVIPKERCARCDMIRWGRST